MFTRKTIQSESGLFCNVQKRVIDEDECDYIEERRNCPYEITEDYNFKGYVDSLNPLLYSCNYCSKQYKIPTWDVPPELQKYIFPKPSYKDIVVIVLLISIASSFILIDFFILISIL